MADVVSFRSNIKTEDVQFRSSVSEAVGNKIGASINFINTRQTDSKLWTINGNYYNSFTKVGIDGAYICSVDMEVYSITMYNLVAGSSGTTTFDLIRHTGSGVAGSSIFVTKPSLGYGTGNNAFLGYRFFDSTVLEAPSGCVLPTLVSMNLDAGDMITCDMTDTQVFGQSAGITLELRPR